MRKESICIITQFEQDCFKALQKNELKLLFKLQSSFMINSIIIKQAIDKVNYNSKAKLKKKYNIKYSNKFIINSRSSIEYSEIINEVTRTILNLSNYTHGIANKYYIPKPDGGSRPIIVISNFDKIIQLIVLWTLNPINEYYSDDISYGYRKNLGVSNVVLKIINSKYFKHAYKIDISGFFDNIPHVLIDSYLKPYLNNGICNMISQALVLQIKDSKTNKIDVNKFKGVPQGMPISPLLSNIALWGFGDLVKNQSSVVVRYSDDIIILSNSCYDLNKVFKLIELFLKNCGLSISESKKKYINLLNSNFEFLGWSFTSCNNSLNGYPSDKNINKINTNIINIIKRGLDPENTILKINHQVISFYHSYSISKYSFESLNKIHFNTLKLFEIYNVFNKPKVNIEINGTINGVINYKVWFNNLILFNSYKIISHM